MDVLHRRTASCDSVTLQPSSAAFARLHEAGSVVSRVSKRPHIPHGGTPPPPIHIPPAPYSRARPQTPSYRQLGLGLNLQRRLVLSHRHSHPCSWEPAAHRIREACERRRQGMRGRTASGRSSRQCATVELGTTAAPTRAKNLSIICVLMGAREPFSTCRDLSACVLATTATEARQALYPRGFWLEGKLAA